MDKDIIGKRWIFVLFLFTFILLHQFDLVLLSSFIEQRMMAFNVDTFWEDPLVIFGFFFGFIFYLIWGFLYDRYSRKKILSLVGFLWGMTSLLVGIAPTYATFVISYIAAGVDNTSVSGIYALVGDLYHPKHRGKVLSMLYLSQPLALLFSIIIIPFLGDSKNLRYLLLTTALIGFILALIVARYFWEPKRGASEPALKGNQLTGVYLFDSSMLKSVLKKPSLIFVILFSFTCIIPLFTLSNYIFALLKQKQAIPDYDIFMILLPAIIALMLGYPFAGILGDRWFRKNKNGRILISMVGLVLSIIFLYSGFQSSDFTSRYFSLMMVLTGFSMAFTWPNILAAVFDFVLPELRASVSGFILLFQALGAVFGPMLVAVFQPRLGLGGAILWVCVGSWLISLIFLVGLLYEIPKDVEQLRRHMAYRSHLEVRLVRPNSHD